MDILLVHETTFRHAGRGDDRKQVVTTVAEEITVRTGEQLTEEEMKKLEGVS